MSFAPYARGHGIVDDYLRVAADRISSGPLTRPRTGKLGSRFYKLARVALSPETQTAVKSGVDFGAAAAAFASSFANPVSAAASVIPSLAVAVVKGNKF